MFSIKNLAILFLAISIPQFSSAETPFDFEFVFDFEFDDERVYVDANEAPMEPEEAIAEEVAPIQGVPRPHFEAVRPREDSTSDFDSDEDQSPRPKKKNREVDSTPLMQAVQAGDIHEVLRLSEQTDFDVDAQNEFGATALHIAVAANHVGMVQLLLHLKADRTITNAAGETPLQKAQIFGFDDVASELA